MGVAILEFCSSSESLFLRLVALVYLGKLYKMIIFNYRFHRFIIGTAFFKVYNIVYGLFVLIILVSYVGCIFYQIDYILYVTNYEYQSLLWVN